MWHLTCYSGKICFNGTEIGTNFKQRTLGWKKLCIVLDPLHYRNYMHFIIGLFGWNMNIVVREIKYWRTLRKKSAKLHIHPKAVLSMSESEPSRDWYIVMKHIVLLWLELIWSRQVFYLQISQEDRNNLLQPWLQTLKLDSRSIQNKIVPRGEIVERFIKPTCTRTCRKENMLHHVISVCNDEFLYVHVCIWMNIRVNCTVSVRSKLSFCFPVCYLFKHICLFFRYEYLIQILISTNTNFH